MRSNPNLATQERAALGQRVEAEVGCLPERMRVIVHARYGLDDGRLQTLEEIADEHDLTTHRVLLLEQEAMKTLSARLADE